MLSEVARKAVRGRSLTGRYAGRVLRPPAHKGLRPSYPWNRMPVRVCRPNQAHQSGRRIGIVAGRLGGPEQSWPSENVLWHLPTCADHMGKQSIRDLQRLSSGVGDVPGMNDKIGDRKCQGLPRWSVGHA